MEDDFKKRLEDSISAMDKVLKLNSIQMRPMLTFPRMNKDSVYIKIFLWIFKKIGGIADLKFFDLKQKNA